MILIRFFFVLRKSLVMNGMSVVVPAEWMVGVEVFFIVLRDRLPY